MIGRWRRRDLAVFGFIMSRIDREILCFDYEWKSHLNLHSYSKLVPTVITALLGRTDNVMIRSFNIMNDPILDDEGLCLWREKD